ncbi:MAG: hypothetical protein RR365_02295 [Bacteroides sp.]
MEDTPVLRAEYQEYRLRMGDENTRQDKRISLLEENTKQIGSLTISVEKLAQSIELMVKEQEKQGRRLEVLESRDGAMWRKMVGYVVTAVVGILIGFIFTQIGM